ncbi:carbonic anhydrase [Kitasatospora azatica]|uniref:carbonic anhydrase n=1 Tax=Kitasatospora azatica TaxID=58347 RepID=UPI00068C061A|nr:carbonic anhydrase [Kitasatospora azatica]
MAALSLVSNAAAPPARASTPQEALDRLRAGNDNWVRGRARRPDASLPRREELARRQEPVAVVFTCIDSRVPPELVFDQGLGDLLVVRTAAHTHDSLVAGSLEYGPAELATRLLVVLGHQRCGAVSAAVQAFRSGDAPPGHLADVTEDLRPAYEEALGQGPAPEQLIEATVRAQTRQTVTRLRTDRLLRPLLAAGALEIVGGYYSLDTGAVAISR